MKKLILSIIVSLSILTSNIAYAGLTSIMFKGVDKFFKKTEYSLILGMIALESGFLHNQRFNGPMNWSYKKDEEGNLTQERLYNGDKALKIGDKTDATAALVFELFHSPAGSLAAHQGGLDKISGQLIKSFDQVVTPEIMALLMNYSQELTDILSETVKQNTSSNIQRQLNKEIQFKEIQSAKALNLKKELNKKFRILLGTQAKKHISEIVNSLERAIYQDLEKDPDQQFLYPKNMVQQILSGYFCYRFNCRQDIISYLHSLNQNILNSDVKQNLESYQQTFNSQEINSDVFTAQDLNKVSRKPIHNLEDVYFIFHAADFENQLVTPYKNNCITNSGSCKIFDRLANNFFIPTESSQMSSYSDCAENAARNFLNLILEFEGIQFNLEYLRNHINNLKNKLSELKFKKLHEKYVKFEEFMTKQNILYVNSGDIEIRSLFGAVINDLNHDNDAIKIWYGKSQGTIQYELFPGIVNTLLAFDKVFGLSFDELDQHLTLTLEEKTKWVSRSIDKLMEVFSPHWSAKLDFSRVYNCEKKGNERELRGNLNVVIKDNYTQKELFTFDFRFIPGKHAEIKSLKVFEQDISNENFQRYLQTKPLEVLEETKESIWLISPNFHDRKKLNHPLYRFFSEKIDNHTSRGQFLKTLIDGFEDWNKISRLQKMQLKSIAGNILKDFSWNDYATVKNIISPMLWKINKSFEDIFPFEFVKSLNWHGNIEQLKCFSHLEDLIIEKDSSVTIHDIDNHFQSLRKVIFENPSHNLSVASFNKSLKEVVFKKPLDKIINFSEKNDTLEKLVFHGKEFEKIEGLKNMQNLKELYFCVSDLKNFNATGLSNLQKLDFMSCKDLQVIKVGEQNKDLFLNLQYVFANIKPQVEGEEYLNKSNILWPKEREN